MVGVSVLQVPVAASSQERPLPSTITPVAPLASKVRSGGQVFPDSLAPDEVVRLDFSRFLQVQAASSPVFWSCLDAVSLALLEHVWLLEAVSSSFRLWSLQLQLTLWSHSPSLTSGTPWSFLSALFCQSRFALQIFQKGSVGTCCLCSRLQHRNLRGCLGTRLWRVFMVCLEEVARPVSSSKKDLVSRQTGSYLKPHQFIPARLFMPQGSASSFYPSG